MRTYHALGRLFDRETSMDERRNTPRQKSFLRGCIHFNDRRAAIECLIRDISEQGARLIFSSTVAIPDDVDLYIPQKDLTLHVHVKWRHGDEIGVAFVAVVQSAGSSVPEQDGALDERVQRLEAEVAALRRTVKRLQAAAPQAADMDVA